MVVSLAPAVSARYGNKCVRRYTGEMKAHPLGALFSIRGRGAAAFAATLATVLLLTGLSYAPGLSGPLLMDDLWTLQPLLEGGGIESRAEARRFVFDNDAGPLGRPVAMLSFLLDSLQAPPDASLYVAALKRTNLLLHLLTGLALCWFLRLLTRQLGMSVGGGRLLAVAVATLWLVHPLNLSTTLYVVQRMTQLMTLFVLLGLAFYLWGRRHMQTRPGLGATLLCLALFPLGLLALLSKENGALLLLLIVLSEWLLLPRRPQNRFFRYWYLGGVVLPLLCVFAYLVYSLPQMLALYEIRPFDLGERLLTEPRVLSDYLWKIVVPIAGVGNLYHDDLRYSASLLTPITTLLAMLFIGGLLLSAVLLRKRAAVFSFAVFWFLGMHVLESSYLPLELYFEHRNYLAMIGPLFALAWYVRLAWVRWLPLRSQSLLGGIAGLYVLVMLGTTCSLALLWGDAFALHRHWAEQQPQSARAQLTYAGYLASAGQVAEASRRIAAARELNPAEITTLLYAWNHACEQGSAAPETLSDIVTQPQLQHFQGDLNIYLRILLENYFADVCVYPEPRVLVAMFDRIGELPLPDFKRAGYHVYFSDLYISLGQLDPALINLARAFEARPNPRFPLRQALISASAGRFADALVFLGRAREADRNRNPALPSILAEIESLENDFRSRIQ